MASPNPKHVTTDHVNYLIWRYVAGCCCCCLTLAPCAGLPGLMQVITLANTDYWGRLIAISRRMVMLRIAEGFPFMVIDNIATGFGEAAVKFEQKWNNDPRKLPFANNVGLKALQHLVQKGLEFNAIQKQLRNVSRHRFVWRIFNHRFRSAQLGGACISLDAVLWHPRRPSPVLLVAHSKAVGNASRSSLTRTAQAWPPS